MTRAVKLFADSHIIGTIQHHMMRLNQGGQLIIIQLFGDRFGMTVRIDRFQRNGGGFCFCHPDAGISMQDLTLQIGE